MVMYFKVIIFKGKGRNNLFLLEELWYLNVNFLNFNRIGIEYRFFKLVKGKKEIKKILLDF